MSVAYYINTECEIKKVTPESGNTFGLAELQQYVEGYVEIIPLGGRWVMVCNEEGVLLHEGYNEWASILADTPIVGNVVVCTKEMVK